MQAQRKMAVIAHFFRLIPCLFQPTTATENHARTKTEEGKEEGEEEKSKR
jgi:hypothetical protein